MTLLLPFIEHSDIYQAMDLTKSYRDITAGHKVPGTAPPARRPSTARPVLGNVWAATRHITTYVCPSNPYGDPTMRDPAGFGGTDYFATVYTDIDADPSAARPTAPATRPRARRALDRRHQPDRPRHGVDGPYRVADSRLHGHHQCADQRHQRRHQQHHRGDRGCRPGQHQVVQQRAGAVLLPLDVYRQLPPRLPPTMLPDDVTGDATGDLTGADGERRVALGRCRRLRQRHFRPVRQYAATRIGPYTGKVINQNAYPVGGVRLPTSPSAAGVKGAQGTNCSWTQNNCGANDEPFGFHTGGCNCVMVDGSVRFLSDKLDPVTLRRLVTRSEGIPIDNDECLRKLGLAARKPLNGAARRQAAAFLSAQAGVGLSARRLLFFAGPRLAQF